MFVVSRLRAAAVVIIAGGLMVGERWPSSVLAVALLGSLAFVLRPGVSVELRLALCALLAALGLGVVTALDPAGAMARAAVVVGGWMWARLLIDQATSLRTWLRWSRAAAAAVLAAGIVGMAARLTGAGVVNANALGGTMLFGLPLAVAWMADVDIRTRGAAIVASLCVLGVIVWSESQSALAAVPLALVMVAWARWPRTAAVRWVTFGVAATTLAAMVAVWVSWAVGAQLPDQRWMTSIEPRFDIWSRAWLIVRDVPFSGIGLDEFRDVVAAYAPDVTNDFSSGVAHAHNIWLQTALDLGVPGLVVYVALLVHVAKRGLAAGSGAPEVRMAVWGSLAAVTAVHVFGATDAIALGTKVGVFLWWHIALIVSAPLEERTPSETSTQQSQDWCH